MHGVFGRGDGATNSVLFGLYHLHQSWSIPSAIVTGSLAAHASSWMRSAWLGIIAYSAQNVVFIVIGLVLVL